MMLKLKLQYFDHLMQRTDSWKGPWCWERLKVGGEGDNRGWDGWMASPTQWTWVWVNSRSWWWTGRPDVLRFMRSQRVGHNWATELKWTEASIYSFKIFWKFGCSLIFLLLTTPSSPWPPHISLCPNACLMVLECLPYCNFLLRYYYLRIHSVVFYTFSVSKTSEFYISKPIKTSNRSSSYHEIFFHKGVWS